MKLLLQAMNTFVILIFVPAFLVTGLKRGSFDENFNDREQFLLCYNDSGHSMNFTKNEYNLTKIGWDNQISRCCFNGIWLLYEETNYNDGNPNAVSLKISKSI